MSTRASRSSARATQVGVDAKAEYRWIQRAQGAASAGVGGYTADPGGCVIIGAVAAADVESQARVEAAGMPARTLRRSLPSLGLL